MRLLIDSDVFIDYVQEKPSGVSFLAELAPTGVAITAITYLEVFDGVLKGPPDEIARFRSKLARLPIIEVDEVIAERAANLRHELRRAGKNPRARSLDLIVAATALVHGLTLVTRNQRHFRDIPGLALYDSVPGS
ncbi:MAG: type II toxin-antitoxin system VapC family toxin [Thermomicrobiales bacterium]|nr:type II toxin-antitoxin system VapC family toxin [Thermomicrobiales bacterium]